MTARRLILATTIGFGIAGLPALAGEDDFIYVDRLPEVRGEHRRTVTVDDRRSGQTVVQDVYAEEFDHALIETYVLRVVCAGRDAAAEAKTYVVALKYPPKTPTSFTIATLHDVYKEVYVDDGSGKVRLYEDVRGPSMPTLSERFRPSCLPV